MKNKQFYGYLAGATAVFVILIQLFGVFEEAKQKDDYYKWRSELHQKYAD